MTMTATTHHPFFIGGSRVEPTDGGYYSKTSPVTGLSIGRFAAASPDDAAVAVEIARQAQAAWASESFVTRRRVLLRAADLLEADLAEHTQTFALETGGVSGWAAMNVMEAAATLREAAGLASASRGEILPSHDPATTNFSHRGPAGVVLAIVPWNAPLILAARSTAIALALGNTVIIRPSEESPLTAGHILADALSRAGAPDGVVNVLTTAPGEGRHVITALIENPAVRRVVFIGSTPVGRRIAATAGAALTPAVLELGGKNVTIVRADADLDHWAPQLAFASFANSGQVCMCTDTILAHESIADELTERLSAIATDMVVGDPRDPATELGPLIHERAATSFSDLVNDARSSGAAVAAGGSRDGLFARPTVLTGVGPEARFFTEEGFAPIVSVTPTRNDDDAVAAANAGDYGLIASIVSADEGAAERLAHRVHAGAVHVNGPSVGDEPHVPFGGLGASGYGRLGGAESVHFFTEQRTFYRHGA